MSLYDDIPGKKPVSMSSGWGGTSAAAFVPNSIRLNKPGTNPTTTPASSSTLSPSATKTSEKVTTPKKPNPNTSNLSAQVAMMRAKASKLRQQLDKQSETLSDISTPPQKRLKLDPENSVSFKNEEEKENQEGGKRGQTDSRDESHTLFPEHLEDEYDPLKPNDYEKYQKDRMKKRFNHPPPERQPILKMAREPSPPQARSKPVIELDISGEEAFRRRGLLSGGGGGGGGGVGGGVGVGVGGGGGSGFGGGVFDPVAGSDDFATRMMKKMGWREGQGLGKSDQGMKEPLEVNKTGKKTGKVISSGDISTVVLLENMVGPGEVDEDLESETIEECSKFGKILQCKIIELGDGVRIFLHFSSPSSSQKAKESLHRRFFGGRTVSATFYPEAAFKRRDYFE